MPSRAPITDEEMQQLRDRMEQWFAAKSTRTPPPAPSQTFGMQTHSARRTGPRQRYDPQAAAEARHADRMRLAELRKTVDAEKATAKAAQEVKRAERLKKNLENPTIGGPHIQSGDRGNEGLNTGAFYQTRSSRFDGPAEKTVAEDYYATRQRSRDDQPISPMYNVTPSQYLAAYGVPFTGSDPDSMRRLLALQNGTASVIGSERGVIDQRQTDKDNADKYANMKPAEGVVPNGIREGSDYQRRAWLQIPEADIIEAKRRDNQDEAQRMFDENDAAESEKRRKVIENAQRVAGITPESIDASDRQREAELERIRQGRIFDLNSSSPSERFGIPPTQTMSQMMDPDSPMATGPGRKGLPRGTAPRK